MNSKAFLLVLAALLLLVAGPMFGPVPVYLVRTMDTRAAAAWEMVLFLAAAGIVFGVVRIWMRSAGRTMADLGWGRPSTRLATVSGTLLGVVWGVFGIFGYLQFVPTGNVFEISLYRLLLAFGGVLVAILEDLMTRGLVMNELQRLGASASVQVIASSLLFTLYHTVWGFNVIAFVFSLVYALLLAGLFVMGKRSLTPVILAHSLAFLVGEPFLTLTMMEAIKMAIS